MINDPDHGVARITPRFSTRGDGYLLLQPGRAVSRLLATVGYAAYEYERYAKECTGFALEIGVEQRWDLSYLNNRVRPVFERLVRHTLLTEPVVSFARCESQFQSHTPNVVPSTEAVSLFSGGVDSVAGMLALRQDVSDIVGVFASHSYQSRIVSTVRKIGTEALEPLGITLLELPAPKVDITGYSQTRGFLYMLLGAAVAVALGAKRLIVNEVGPTMYQPQYSATDNVTMTTHPFVVARAQEIIQRVARRGIRIETPFEDRTKAEIMATCPQPQVLPRTHSCVSQRLETHDGTCHGCVIRRLGALAANVPDVVYSRNPIEDETASGGNLLSVLEFCALTLTGRDRLPGYSRSIVDAYRKWALFERFALDNYAALHRLRCDGTKLAPGVNVLYEHVRRSLGAATLRKRLRELAAIRRAV